MVNDVEDNRRQPGADRRGRQPEHERGRVLPKTNRTVAAQSELEAVTKGSYKMKPLLEGTMVNEVIVLPARLVNIVLA